MSKRPALANLFAYGARDRGQVATVAASLRASGRYDGVWCPHPAWVFASAGLGEPSLPGGDAAGPFAFAEGREAMLGAGGSTGELAHELARDAPALARWPGDFTFLWCGPEGRVSAVRSCAGRVPLYFWEAADRTVVATQCDALIRFGGWRGALDRVAAATWSMAFSGNFLGRSHLAGVRALGAGESVRLGPGGGETSAPRGYWHPQPGSRPARDPASALERQQRLRALLLKRLDEDLDPRGGNLLTLSGGVDSAALLGLAARTLARPMMTWSQLPPPSAPTRARELSYIEPLRTWAGVTRHFETDVTPDEDERLILAAPPIPFPVLHPALCVLGEIRRQSDVRVLVGGEFGDEICGDRVTTPDWASGTTLAELLLHPSRWPYGASAPARWLKSRTLHALRRPYLVQPDCLPAFCPPALQAAYRDERAGVRAWAMRLPPTGRYLLTRHRTHDFAAMNWEACSHYGIRRSIPFLSRETIELTMACHPSELIGPGTKRLLRGALRDDVPAPNLQRADKGHFGLQFAELRRPLADLRLHDDGFWDALADIVSPHWRRATLAQGWIRYEDRYPLLYLMLLQENLQRAFAQC